jgi:hypothetical protein
MSPENLVQGRPLGTVLLISSAHELPVACRVWGTGGRTSPEEREALDWLTLCRLLGWSVEVVRSGDPHFANTVKRRHRCIIVGCPPDELSPEEAALLLACIAESPVLLVTRLGREPTPLDAGVQSSIVLGTSLSWQGPGPEMQWKLRKPEAIETITPTREGIIWAALDDVPIIAARPIQKGCTATLAFHPSSARDLAGYFTVVLRHLLIFGPACPVQWLDLSKTLILRMDDPGGAQNVHSGSWAHRKLDRAAWRQLSQDLASRSGRLSIGYVSGWVDDGDASRGSLRVGAQAVPRRPGEIFPSPLVEYRDLTGHQPGTVHDYADEFAGIQDLCSAGTGEVELHGYTHMHPDRARWVLAPDRYEDTRWYREFGAEAARHYVDLPLEQHPLHIGMRQIERWFGTRPTTLIFPGDQWTESSMEFALDLGLELVSSYYLALRHGDRFCWAIHACAPYLDLARPEWFDAGLPVVGYFHDRDLATAGTSWMREWLDQWTASGARNLIDFRTLTNALALAGDTRSASPPRSRSRALAEEFLVDRHTVRRCS